MALCAGRSPAPLRDWQASAGLEAGHSRLALEASTRGLNKAWDPNPTWLSHPVMRSSIPGVIPVVFVYSR